MTTTTTTRYQSVFPADRETVPAGKVRLAEYGDVSRDDMAPREVLRETRRGADTYRLYVVGPGWEFAGSVLRWTDGYYGAQAVYGRQPDTTHGRKSRVATALQDMTALYESWTNED